LLDSYIDGYQRTTTLFFGRIVSNPDDMPAFEEPLGYNMTYNAMATGNGNALHRHNSVEIFVALDAPFEIAYGSHGEFKALLQPWDVVACPAEAIHSYKNMGEDGGQILTFLCGKPSITWANGVVAEARQNGAVCDDTGILLKHSVAKAAPLWSSEMSDSECSWGGSRQDSVETVPSEADLEESLQRRLSLMGKDASELTLEAGDLDPFVFRYTEQKERSLKISGSAGTMAVHWKDLEPGENYSPEGDEDTLIIVLSGSVICQHRHYNHLDVIKQPTALVAGTQRTTLLVTRSDLPHNLNFFFDADIASDIVHHKWSPCETAERKVTCDVVWEVPPNIDTPELRPDFAVAKYSKIKPLNAALLDSYINGYQRTTTLFFGRIVSNPDDLPAFEEPLGYNMTYNAMVKGNGNALHRHNSVEIFVALDAPFEIAYGSHGEFKALLQPWDVVACPAEAIHSYKNMGQDGGQILTFLCGKPSITWANGVVAEARQNGAVCDDSGILLNHSPSKPPSPKKLLSPWKEPPMGTYERSDSEWSWEGSQFSSAEVETVPTEEDLQESLERRLKLMGKEAPELILKKGDLDPFVFRYAEHAERSLKINCSTGGMAVHWKDLEAGEDYTPDGEEDTLIIVLSGSVICEHRHYAHLDVIKQPTFLTAGAHRATLLVTRSSLPHNLNFFFDADIRV